MRYIVMAMILVLTCLDLSTAQAAATPGERESLAGLQGVGIVIEGITPEADGLLKDNVRTAVELILRSSGIRVLTSSERAMTPSAPYLYVNINAMKSKTGANAFYAVATSVQLSQLVSLAHRPGHTTFAPTYELGGVGIYSTHLLRGLISDAIESNVKTFANDFLAVNPR